MKIAYCDCFSGISGDMFLAALIDAGLPLAFLRESLAKIGFGEKFEIDTRKVMKGAIEARMIDIKFEPSHHHRRLSDIQNMLNTSQLPPLVVTRSLAIFRALAEAEAKVHGCQVEEVHFHEVGAVDSLIDIVGAAIGLEYLGIEQLFASALPSASGQIKTDHGLIPLPAPATLELMKKGKMTIVPSPSTKELVTPTGAAILSSQAVFSQPSMRIEGIGIGAGRRDLPWPNILRLIVGESINEASGMEMVVIETNIDDMNPQLYASVQADLFKAGAQDVFTTSIQMKKNRPATMLSVIARRSDEHVLADILLRETTTFGVRVSPIRRYEAERKMVSVSTNYGEVLVKLKIIRGQVVMAMPEYEDCRVISENRGLPLMEVYQSAIVAAQQLVPSR